MVPQRLPLLDFPLKLIPTVSLAPSTAFITLSITGADFKYPSPGNKDPSIALLLADSVREAWSNTLSTNPRRQQLAKRSQFYVSQSMRMRTGGNRPWWSAAGDPVAEDEMTYQCDIKLGSPKEVGCAKVEWSEVGEDRQTFSLVPGVARTLSSSKYADGQRSAVLTLAS